MPVALNREIFFRNERNYTVTKLKLYCYYEFSSNLASNHNLTRQKNARTMKITLERERMVI